MGESNVIDAIVKSTVTVSADGSPNGSKMLTTKSSFQMTGCCSIDIMEEIAAMMVTDIAERAFQDAGLPDTIDNYKHFISQVAGKTQMSLQMRQDLAACKAEHKSKRKTKEERSKTHG